LHDLDLDAQESPGCCRYTPGNFDRSETQFYFWAFLILLCGGWITFLVAGISAVAISAIPLLTYGWEIYRQWFEASTLYTPSLLLFPANNLLSGANGSFWPEPDGTVLSILLVLSLTIFVVFKRPAQLTSNTLGIVGSLLISPIAWTGYTLLTLPYFFEKKHWPKSLYIVAAVFAIAFPIPLTLFTKNQFNFVVFGWFYGWGLLVLLATLLIRSKSDLETEDPHDNQTV
jgi:hypothetical protein